MKSTKVQNPRRILLHALRASSLVNYANARARKLATPRVVAVTRVRGVGLASIPGLLPPYGILSRTNNITRVTFEPCAVVRAWKIFIT